MTDHQSPERLERTARDIADGAMVATAVAGLACGPALVARSRMFEKIAEPASRVFGDLPGKLLVSSSVGAAIGGIGTVVISRQLQRKENGHIARLESERTTVPELAGRLR